MLINKIVATLILGSFFLLPRGAIAESAAANKGWGVWQQMEPTESLDFASGFSNAELGGYLDYSYLCEQAAETANDSPLFWYRLDDLVKTIGTGKVEYRCTINDEVIAHHTSTATLNNAPFPFCLTVQSNIGGGVNVRKDPELAAPLLGFLNNGDQIFIKDSPLYLSTDMTGRTWLNLQFQGQNAWSSLMAEEGGHINYQMCQ